MADMTLDEYHRKYGRNKKVRVRGRAGRKIDWKLALETQMQAADLPAPEQEYLFHEKRKWRFDYAWVVEGVALEFEGGIWMQTETGRSKGHAHPKRFLSDCEKYNEAALYGR